MTDRPKSLEDWDDGTPDQGQRIISDTKLRREGISRLRMMQYMNAQARTFWRIECCFAGGGLSDG